MTDYHPVSREEHCQHECVCRDFNKIVYGDGRPCPKRKLSGTFNCDHDTRIRPDTLALMEAWREYARKNTRITERSDWSDLWFEERDFIKQFRENPEAVLKELKEKGVWKE